jgi:lysophospholipase L1-like esterase
MRTLILSFIFLAGIGLLAPSGSNAVTQEKLLASDGVADDRFGTLVALSGVTAVVGAQMSGNPTIPGSAYVFRYDGSGWFEQAKLTASDAAADDRFGYVVAVSGDTAVVGAFRDDDNGTDSGSAYVFRYDGSSWIEEQKLLASDGNIGDSFGSWVAISGDTIVVGAYLGYDGGNRPGSAYVFRYDGSSWVEESKLAASDGEADDWFGVSVAVSGDTAVVGASGGDDNGTDSGSAYVFHYDGSSWIEQPKLTASDGAALDGFGLRVAVSGDTAVVGASGDDDNGENSGSAYVFRYDGSSWIEQPKLTASDGAALDGFGTGVAVSGDTAVVGAFFDDDNGTNSGSAYVFHGVASSPVPINYVALGDSYSAGEGVGGGKIGPYMYPTDEPGPVPPENFCHRSQAAYSSFVETPTRTGQIRELFERGEPGFDWQFHACSGAVTYDVRYRWQYDNQQPQVDELSEGTDLVTITIGGNDAGFVSLVTKCMEMKEDCHTSTASFTGGDTLEDWLYDEINTNIRNRLWLTFDDIKQNVSSDTAIFVLGYPQLVSGLEVCEDVSIAFFDKKLTVAEQKFFRRMAVHLNGVAAEEASNLGIHFVNNVAEHFAGYELCGANEEEEFWFFGIEAVCTDAWWGFGWAHKKHCGHPNEQGQKEYAKALHAFIDGKRQDPDCQPLLPTGLPPNGCGCPPEGCAPGEPSAMLAEVLGPATTFGDLGIEPAVPPCPTWLMFIPGQEIRLTGSGFAAGASVSAIFSSGEFTGELGPVTADGLGELDALVTIPAGASAPSGALIEAVGAGPDSSTHVLIAGMQLTTGFADDGDLDGVPDACDNCPDTAGADQTDTDGDGSGDICDVCPDDLEDDWDQDGFCAVDDPCPLDAENDVDRDLFCADDDNCPQDFNPDQLDANGDGVGNVCVPEPAAILQLVAGGIGLAFLNKRRQREKRT